MVQIVAILKDGIYGENTEERETPSLWLEVFESLRNSSKEDMFNVWIRPLVVLNCDNQLLILKAPNEFSVQFLRLNWESKILSSIQALTGETWKVQFVAHSDINLNSADSDTEDNISSIQNVASTGFNFTKANGPEARNNKSYRATFGFVNSNNTFDTFIVGAGTQFAHAAAKGVAMHPGDKYNPLVIYGPSGLGKTHLLHAIANDILHNNPEARICYMSAEDFVTEFIRSTQEKSINEFKNRYRSKFDVFLIDDIQFFGGKDMSQEEFFHTFNYLCSAQHQVVITSDKAPKELVTLEERLVSRLQQGLVVDIKPPDLETRIAILRSKAEALDLYIPDDVYLLIASNIRTNVRELHGALVRLSAEASFNRTEITIEMAREALADILKENKGHNITLDSIVRSVSQRFQISIADLNSKSRKKKHAEPRQIAMYLCRKYTKKTYQDIASAFGGKDHTTVIHAIDKIEKNLITDPMLRKSLEDIQQLL